MSTRCHIIITKSNEPNHYVYHHCDGYPEGVGEDLKEFFESYSDNDISTPDKLVDALNFFDSQFEIEDEDNGTGSNGEYAGLHGDEEYIYTIDYDTRLLTCYNLRRMPDGSSANAWDIPENEVRTRLIEFTYKF